MSRECAVADAHLRYPGKRRLERSQKLALLHAVHTGSLIYIRYVSAHIRIKEDRIRDPVGIFAITPDRDIDVEADVPVDHPERNGRRRAILVPHDLFRIKVIYPLISGCHAAEGKSLPDLLKGPPDALAQISLKNRRRPAAVIRIFARLRANLRNLSFLHDHHTLSVRHRDQGAVRYDIVVPAAAGKMSRRLPTASLYQNLRIH